ncbi:MAG: LCP family protein [Anaerolineae bacterium]|nr:LCP family protein [Anaerolineae bacterium]
MIRSGPLESAKVIATLLTLCVLAACSTARQAMPVPPPIRITPTPTFVLAASIKTQPTPVPTPQAHSKPVTLLLLGVDWRGPGSELQNTDTLMLFYLDQEARRIVILSIPRDLYVDIPGHGQGRINTAYALGERDGTGGLALACQTVSATLGIPVQHAVLVDFNAFITLVDAIGGVEVDVPYPIADPHYPDSGTGYDPFYLPAGKQHLDGATALKYARTRATSGGDFDRTARQRQLVLAARDRVLQLDLLPSLINRAPQIWSTLNNAVETNLPLAELAELATAAAQVPSDRITSAAIDQSCTHVWITPDGAHVLLPDREAIRILVNHLFATPPAFVSTE